MSAFLGPIHHWLFGKIKIQNTLVEELVSYSNKKYGKELLKEIDSFGTIPTANLEDIIDGSNIHGWLQEHVSIVEHRLAFVVIMLLKNETIDNIKEISYELGRRVSNVTKDTTVSEAYKFLNDTLLDGMPCDHAISIVDQDTNTLTLNRNVCVHKDYWNSINGDVQYYYILREQFIKGLLEKADISYVSVDEKTYLLEKMA